MEDCNSGKWIGWNGGECPVHPETVVEVALTDHNGSKSNGKGTLKAKEYMWDHIVSAYKIIAFRVIKEHKEPREWWSVGSVNYPTIELAETALASAKARGAFAEKIIHVREVLE